MTIIFQTKKEIEEEVLDQDIELNCTRATCMATFIITKREYKRLMEDEKGVKCPLCGHKSL